MDEMNFLIHLIHIFFIYYFIEFMVKNWRVIISMEISKDELIYNLNRLIELSFFICHDTVDYTKNRKTIKKAIRKIENGDINEIMNEEVNIE